MKLLAKYSRQINFAGVGIIVVGAGFLILFLLTKSGVSPILANLIQAVVTVELNFVLSNLFTWGDRKERSLWHRWYTFNVSKVVIFLLSQGIFVTLTGRFLLNALVVYALCAIVSSIVNYFTNDRMVFSKKRATKT